jgi:hemolysin III
MTRTRLSERQLPRYSRGEEIMNMVTHIVGGGMGVIALAFGTVKAALSGDGYAIAGAIVFGLSLMILYTMSSIYHGLSVNVPTAKKVFQILDHCTIFVLIAGTYTPITICSIREYDPVIAWTVFGVVWGAAALGIVLNSIDIKKYSKFSMICYLAMGWCIVFTGDTIVKSMSLDGALLVLFGGIMYSIGAIFYGFTKKCRYMHSVFHILTCIGSAFHIAAVTVYVL